LSRARKSWLDKTEHTSYRSRSKMFQMQGGARLQARHTFCSMLSEEAAATTQQMDIFQRELFIYG